MDWKNPLRSIAATVDADVLKALAGAQEPVTGNQLAHLAGRSYAQVYAVSGRLVDDGMVRCVRYGRTKTYRLNRDHVLSPIIDRMLAAPARIENEIRQAGLAWQPAAASIAFAGPAARRLDRMGLRSAIHDDQPGGGSLAQGVRTLVGEDPRLVASAGDRERQIGEGTL